MRSLIGTRRLIRLALRRDRWVLPITIGLVVLMMAGSAPALTSTYPDQASQFTYIASSAPSVVGRMFQGTVQGVNIGSILMAETFIFTAVILAVMSIFIVTRHTRKNEEMGSGELIGSSIVGRNAPLTAALAVAVGANLLAGLLIFSVLAPSELLDTTGSAYLSISLAMVGIVFAGITAITVQLSSFSRGANSMATAALGAFFLIRGFGDALGELATDGLSVTASALTWFSPIGWGYQVLPYTQNRVFPLLMMAGAFVVTAGVGYVLMNRRDLGSSMFATKPGPERAEPRLLSAHGLAQHLQRGGLYIWVASMVFVGIIVGVMGEEYRSLFEDSDLFGDLLSSTGASGTFTAVIFATMFSFMVPISAGYIVSGLSKMQDEESSGRIEYLMGTALSKLRWLFSHLGYIVMGLFVIMAAMGLASVFSYYGVATETDVAASDILFAALLNIPALIVFMSIIVLLFSFKGRWLRTIAWTYFTYATLVTQLAAVFKWPQWVSNLSPFTHSPAAPSESISYQPIFILLAVAIGLLLLSSIQFTRRDLALK